MTDHLAIRRALLSVSDKDGLIPLAQGLAAADVQLISTGGTARALREAGLTVTDVSAVTGFPEVMDGRVKTLHPKIHGGLLAQRELKAHRTAMAEHGIEGIDLLIVNLYPFEAMVARGAPYEDTVEQIDIGGPAMLRAAAKNHAHLAVITDPGDYPDLLQAIKDGGTSFERRRRWAKKAFQRTAAYDAAISAWMAAQLDEPFPERITISAELRQHCRYGENPHQQAAFYTMPASAGDADGGAIGVAGAKQLQGKALSYNNINDTDAALELVSDFGTTEPLVAIIKHANPCGVAKGNSLVEAYERALACDPVSAFGGIVAMNQVLDRATAERLAEIFTEVIIAPGIDADARGILGKKKSLRLLEVASLSNPARVQMMLKSVAGGLLVQGRDAGLITASDVKQVSKRAPTEKELADMIFAFRVAKHVKSNAIVYARNLMTVGIGAGQMNRRDSSRIAALRAGEAAIAGAGAAGGSATESWAQGSVVASDAFFPFADGLLAAAEAGATAVIQPGGSIRDEEVIAAADDAGLAMVFTGQRHFRH